MLEADAYVQFDLSVTISEKTFGKVLTWMFLHWTSIFNLTTSETFFTTTSLNIYPTDNEYYDTIRQLLLSVPGVGNVTINAITNQITIETTRGNDTLDGQEIIIDLVIEYDIMCLT